MKTAFTILIVAWASVSTGEVLVPDIDHLIITPPADAIKIEGIERLPGGVQNEQVITPVMGGMAFAQIQDGGITAAVGLSILKIAASNEMSPLERDRAYDIVLRGYDSYLNRRANTPEEAQIETAADMYTEIALDLGKSGLSLFPGGSIYSTGVDIVKRQVEASQAEFLKEMRDGLPSFHRNADAAKPEIGLKLTRLAQGNPAFEKKVGAARFLS